MAEERPDRAAIFIDGNNWYHSLRDAGVESPRRLSYARISQKLVGERRWVETRYYIGSLKQDWNRADYAAQRAFLSRIQGDEPRISVQLGRLERPVHENPLAGALLAYVDDPQVQLPPPARDRLRGLANTYRTVKTLKEKAVGIMLARDVLEYAVRDWMDAAYLFSADGDFTPAVESARQRGKKVYIASPGYSSQLVATAFIKLSRHWFADCYSAAPWDRRRPSVSPNSRHHHDR